MTPKTGTSDPTNANPPALSLPIGQKGQFSAIGTFSDGSLMDLTSQASWSITGSGASVNNAGLVTAVSAANGLVVKATVSGKSDQATMNVTAPTLVSIAIIPTGAAPDNQVAPSATIQYKAIGYLDNNTVTADLTPTLTWTAFNSFKQSTPPGTPTTTPCTTLTAGAAGQFTAVAAPPADSLAFITATDPATHVSGQIALLVNPSSPAGSTTTVTLVNNSGYPDEAVYLQTDGKNAAGTVALFNTFCANPEVVALDANGFGFQYSYPLVGIAPVQGSHTYSFKCPTTPWGNNVQFRLSLGAPLLFGANGQGAGNFTSAGINYQMTTPFDFYELSFPSTSTAFTDVSCVDNFSLGSNLTVLNPGTSVSGAPIITSSGFTTNGRSSALSAFSVDPTFNQSAVKVNFTTVQVLSPNQVCSNNPQSTMTTFLDSAIAAGWAMYAGPNNANIPTGGWQYGQFTFTRAPGPASTINLNVADTASPGPHSVLQVPLPTTPEVFKSVLTASQSSGDAAADAEVLNGLLPSVILRGVFLNYSQWGSPTVPNPATPQFYYINKPFDVYAQILHANALNPTPNVPNSGLVFAFPSDNNYDMSGGSGTFNVLPTTNLQITVPPFDQTR